MDSARSPSRLALATRGAFGSVAVLASSVWFLGKLAAAQLLNVVVYVAVGAFMLGMAALALPLVGLLGGGSEDESPAPAR